MDEWTDNAENVTSWQSLEWPMMKPDFVCGYGNGCNQFSKSAFGYISKVSVKIVIVCIIQNWFRVILC